LLLPEGFEEIDRLRAKLELENEYLQTEIKEIFDFGEIVGQSSALKKVLHQIQLVAVPIRRFLSWANPARARS
jgi:transcriptional regulator with GAF, ATPase, and Fis domain